MDSSQKNILQIYGECNNCHNKKSCLINGLSSAHTKEFQSFVQKRHLLKKDARLLSKGDKNSSLFMVKMGKLKSFQQSADENEEINGIYHTSDLINLEAILNQTNHFNVQVMERALLCEIPYEQIELLFQKSPQLQQNLIQAMTKSKEKVDTYIALLRIKSATARFAAFLINEFEFLRQNSKNIKKTGLIISRKDTAKLLRLREETLSRSANQLQREGIIRISYQSIFINNLARLLEVAGYASSNPSLCGQSLSQY